MRRIRAILSIGLLLSIAACKKDEKVPDPFIPPPTNGGGNNGGNQSSYTPPAYADDYSAIASWNQRSSWNLANVHDPTVVKEGEYFYMYGTDASYGNETFGKGGYFPYRRSKDLVNWEFKGFAMSQTPAWVKDTLNNIRSRAGLAPISDPSFAHWAPVIRKVGSKYRLYYSIVVDNYIKTGAVNRPEYFDQSWTEHAFIGLMESDNLAANTWIDKGMVVMSSTDKGNNWSRVSMSDWNAYFKWNAIDPTYIVGAEGQHYLIYGSWHSGIVALALNAETGKPAQLNTLADYGVRIARRQNNDSNRWQAQEGPEIVYNEATGYYYLFLAYDELSVAYNTRVCRSRSITGPYLDFLGNDITAGNECWPMLTHPYKFNNHSGWVGISHVGVFKDDATNNWYLTSQARLPANTNGNIYSNAIMMGHVRQLRFTDSGWPVVMPERYAAVPDSTIADSEIAGTWEMIKLEYQYQVMQTSQTLTLSSNHVASGALSGTWSFDPAKKVLTIGSTNLLVERGVDWEASPRKTTIIFSGLNSTGRSLWGKKK